MRRALAVIFALGWSGAVALPAQTQRVALSVSLGPEAPPRGVRYARYQVRNLLADPKWVEALDQSFAIRLGFKMEIWKSRDGWIDEFQRSTEWSMVIQREPLLDQYRVTEILLSGPVETRFSTREELVRWIGTTREVDAAPVGAGVFYYDITLKLTALSDDEIEELERFLAGRPDSGAQPERSSVSRSLRRLILRLAGLPGEELSVKTERFRIR